MIENINYNGYDFNQENATIENLQGIGMPAIRTSSEDRALQDGALGTSFRFGGRPLGWSGDVVSSDSTPAQYLVERQKIGYALGALTETGKTMTFTLMTGDTRTLRNVVPTGQPIFDFVEGEPSVYWNSYTVTFRADFPYFEGAETSNTQLVTAISGGVVIPAPVAAPLTSSVSSSTAPATLTNAGSAPAFPVFTITGPCVNPKVTNLTTGHTFTINETLLGGETIIVDTWARTAVHSSGRNVIGSMTGGVNGKGDYIYLEGGASGQDNVISFGASSGTTGSTKLKVVYKDAYYML